MFCARGKRLGVEMMVSILTMMVMMIMMIMMMMIMNLRYYNNLNG